MGVLTESGAIREITCGLNLGYVLNDNNDFLLTEYKVLQSQSNGGFIRCMKMLYNGKIQLYYHTTGYKTFTSMLPALNEKGFMTIVTNFLNAILEVKNNGFLSCQNIDISLDKIFVDPSNYTVRLIYVPINIRGYEDFISFENDLRMSLVKLINRLPTLSSQKMSKFYVELSNGALTLESLASGVTGTSPKSSEQTLGIARATMTLMAINAPAPLELVVDRDEYIIGKNPSEVHGVIAFNKAISRIHCKITRVNGSYFLEDLGSSNGTYLNKVRLIPRTSVTINNGDILRLANSEFQVRII